MPSRRAFPLSPLVILLILILAGLLAWRTWMMYERVSAGGAGGAYGAGSRIGVVFASVVILAASIAIAGGIAAAAYRLGNRSESAANLGMIIWLLIPIGLYGYGAYRLATAPARPPDANAGAGGSKTLAQQSREGLERMRALGEEQMNAMEERSRRDYLQRRMNEQSRPVPQAALPGRSPAGAPVPAPAAGSGSSPAPATADPPASATPSPTQPPENPAIKTTLDAFMAELTAQGEAVIAKAEPLFAVVAKPPARDKWKMDARIKDLEALRLAAKEFAKRAKDVSDEAKKRLADAGVSEFDAFSKSIEFTNKFDGFGRSIACDELIRMCDAAKEETELMRDNFGKWKFNRDGTIESTDGLFKGRLIGRGMRIESTLSRKGELIDGLKGE